MEKGSLGRTRKFRKGSIHENASGTFMIMDRYQGDDGKVWLRFQWLSGASEGKIEDNREENINSSLYKFKISRGIREPIEYNPEQVVTPMDNHEKILELMGKIDFIAQIAHEKNKQINTIEQLIIEQSRVIEDLSKMITDDLNNRMLLGKQQELTQKLIEKM